MTGMIDWATTRARMIFAFVLLSLTAGALAYTNLPKEGEPDIDVPVLVVRAPLPGVAAEDAEKLLVRPLEQQLRELEGLKNLNATAAEGMAIVVLEFEFGWDKAATIAETRDKVDRAKADFPSAAQEPVISEINFSEFPILVVSLSGNVPERTLFRIADALQAEVEGLPQVLEAGLAGYREEMLEVLIDPLMLEAYNVTAQELLAVVTNNNQLVAAGEVTNGSGAYSVKIPSSFDDPQDVYNLPVKVNGDRVITLGDLAEIRLTFEDAAGTARYNGEPTVALQVVKRKGVNLIDTVALVRDTVNAQVATWPAEMQEAVEVNFSMDESTNVADMVSQLEASVLTAIALVMIVVLATLGMRSALLVGFAIPTSFLLTFAVFGALNFPVSNIVMFGLILAVGMLVDGAIVVVEYADKRISEGVGPMQAYGAAAKRMFWPIVSSTATTLCAFLPMLFWPGIPGEFMGMLPVTLIFVLSASLVVALLYLPVVGGVAGRLSRFFEATGAQLRNAVPKWVRLLALVLLGVVLFVGFSLLMGGQSVPGLMLMVVAMMALSVIGASLKQARVAEVETAGYHRRPAGRVIQFIVGNPVMPLVTILGVVGFAFMVTFVIFPQNSNGVEFFVETEPERAVAQIRARGNLSLEEKDRLVRQAEQAMQGVEGVESIFAFAGDGGLNQNGGGAAVPQDTIGQIQIELESWRVRGDGNDILDALQARFDQIPGIIVELNEQAQGPADGKPVHLRIKGDNWEELLVAAGQARAKFDATPGLTSIEDSRPLPGIDWQINVDVEAAGRYGADVATVGAMVQLVTRGILLDTMRTETSDEEVEIRVRFPEEARLLSTLDTLRVRTPDGLVPLSNFITREPVPKLAEINRINTERYFDVLADVEPGKTLIELVYPLPDDADPDASPETRALAFGDVADDEARSDLTIAADVPRFFGLFTSEVVTSYRVDTWLDGMTQSAIQSAVDDGAKVHVTPLNANVLIDQLTTWLEEEANLPPTLTTEWTGDREEQEESGAFLMQAMLGALGLMFVILLAQFNSLYNSIAVLLAVIFSVVGVLIGMMVMGQPFSIIMTGTGIVALAGIVVNNNIVLIDTYQEYSRFMPKLEAIVRTVEARLRPVFLTTVTTMAGLAPMMFAVSIDFANGGYSIGAPTALWWTQLATAVVFGLGTATVLTLVFTPAVLALRVWIGFLVFGRTTFDKASDTKTRRNDRDLVRAARKRRNKGDIVWTDIDLRPDLEIPHQPAGPHLSAAE
ncbi:multidrug efflux pump [Rubricella aquisinus]|uniref:Multidrug efflux pump n=1 Tax=Rubricella aquisinus TaxID=2028108 RepID=A0A840WN67_9RHOB|nr:efflux RND transporter permease subunit [Rubricella aquisinus]MBB5516499.1 multidrug efflux pump [Rubricella aquisinus]